MATAPIGKDRKRLIEMVGGRLAYLVWDNPGWWSTFLTTHSQSSRTQLAVHWTHKDLSDYASGRDFEWDFNRK